MDFEWDWAKAKANLAKHGVSFREAETVFGDPLSMTFADVRFAAQEERYLLIGESSIGRLLVVAHTDRDDHTRIISARLATRSERKKYEQA